MKKVFTFAALGVLCGVLSGCVGLVGLGGGHRYADAEKYAVGNFTYAADAVSRVQIHWLSGAVELVAGEGETLSVSENDAGLSDRQKLHWRLDGGTLHIEFAASEYVGNFPIGAKQLRVELPVGVMLEVETVSAPINAGTQSLGGVKIATTSGSVHFEALTADELKIESVSGAQRLGSVETREKTELRSVSGAIKAEDLHAATLQIGSVSGRIELGEAAAAAKIEIESTSGATSAARLQCAAAEVETVSGSITVGLSACAEAEFDTTSGKVHLTLLDGLGATVDFDTASGKFNCADYHVIAGKRVLGDGVCRISVETVSGGLTVD